MFGLLLDEGGECTCGNVIVKSTSRFGWSCMALLVLALFCFSSTCAPAVVSLHSQDNHIIQLSLH